MEYNMEELIPIFSKLAQDYTGFESTSISYERAQSLMEAVIYCLDEYHQVPSAIPETSHISTEEKYELGLCLVKEKAFKIRNIFNELCLSFQDFGVKCLCDTIKSIPEFLKWYNAKFCPQENIITVDYPLLIDLSSLRGANKIYQYILFLQKEQQFLTMFHKNYVIHILEKYSADYENLMENICEIVLTNTIGHIAVQKPLGSLGFGDEDYLQCMQVFGDKTISEMENMISHFIEIVINQVDKGNKYLCEYLCQGTKNMAVRIDNALRYKRLNKLFLL